MIRMLALPSPAGMPALLALLAGAEEFGDICLRRGEKRPLNAINKDAACVRFCVPAEGRPGKPCERIRTPAHKIFILVCTVRMHMHAHACTCWHTCAEGCQMHPEILA
jgi:hypothetical protein